jgi:hypothetical protein
MSKLIIPMPFPVSIYDTNHILSVREISAITEPAVTKIHLITFLPLVG